RGGTVRVWDTTTGSEAFSFKGDTQNVYALAFSPTSPYLAAAGQMGAVRLWNTVGSPGETRLESKTARLVAVAFNKDGRLLAAGGGVLQGLGEVRVWSSEPPSRSFVLTGHTNLVRSVAFSPTRPHLASASDDGTVRIYDLQTRRQIRQCPHGN